jgi:hypothetical protein
MLVGEGIAGAVSKNSTVFEKAGARNQKWIAHLLRKIKKEPTLAADSL